MGDFSGQPAKSGAEEKYPPALQQSPVPVTLMSPQGAPAEEPEFEDASNLQTVAEPEPVATFEGEAAIPFADARNLWGMEPEPLSKGDFVDRSLSWGTPTPEYVASAPSEESPSWRSLW